MKKLITLFFLSILFLCVSGNADAQLLEQDFEASTTVSDYVSATPNNGQFNAIGSSGAGMVLSINTGGDNRKLRFARTGNAGSFSRTTDFSPTPSTLMYRFNLTISGNTIAQTTAAVFQVGSGYGTANSGESNANTYARFGINFTTTDGRFSIRNLTGTATNSDTMSGTRTITWVLNNSGSTISYLAPDGTIETLADDRADIWAGTSRLFNDVNVETPTQVMTDLKFAFTAGTGTIDIDNILIDPVPQVPTSNLPSNITSESFRANWTAVTGVTGYRVDVSTANDFSSFVTGYENLYVSGQSTSFVDVTGLDDETTYYYRVRAASQYDLGEFASGNSTIQEAYTTDVPILIANPNSLSGFTYIFGNGPSASQSYELSGANLIGDDAPNLNRPVVFNTRTPEYIKVIASEDYEISDDDINFDDDLDVEYDSEIGSFGPVTIYVRLKAGLPVDNYNDGAIMHFGGGVEIEDAMFVDLSGSVTEPPPPILAIDPVSLSGFTYVIGSGPSTSQSFDLSGANLIPVAGNILVDATGTDYEVSDDDNSFSKTLNVEYTGGTLNSTELYVRLEDGLSIGDYNAQEIDISGGDADIINLTVSGNVTDIPPSILAEWDISLLPGGVNNYGPSPYAPTNFSSHVNIVGLTRGAGVGTTGTGVAKGWGGNEWEQTSSLENAITAQTFVTFSITPNVGREVSLSEIAPYNIRRSGTGPTTGQWQYQINAGSFVNIGSAITWGGTTTNAGNVQDAIDLSGIGDLQNLTSSSTVTFRIVNYSASGTAGTWYLNQHENSSVDNFTILGNVTGPVLSVSPDSKDFGIVSVGTTSNEQDFLISNIGDGTLEIQSVSLIGGNNDEFTLDDEGAEYPENLLNEESMKVTVTMNPSTSGAKSTTLRIVTQDGNNDYSLTGNGWIAHGNNGGSGDNLYFFATSQQGIGAPFQPQFNWTAPGGGAVTLLQDRVPSGLAVGNADDGRWDITIPAGVNFMIFGQHIEPGDVISIGTNGVYAFNNEFDASHGTTSSLPTATFQHAVLPLWMDLDPGSIDGPVVNRIWYEFRTLPTTELVITFENIAVKTGASTTNYVTFQSLIVYSGGAPTLNSLIKNQYYYDQSGETFISNYNDGTLPDHTVGIQGLNNAEQIMEYRRNTGPGIIFGSNLAVAFGGDDILPADLISFNADVDKNNVILKWSTSWEENNDRFEIKRRVYGDENASWVNAGMVRGAGSTTETTSYTFTDKNLTTGKYEYKLVQFDMNGNSTSDYELNNFVEVGVPARFDISQNYPNPFNPVTKINYEIPVEGLVKIVVYDISGREVSTLVNEVVTPGYHTLEFNAGNFASGVYFYRLVTGNTVMTKKMLLVK